MASLRSVFASTTAESTSSDGLVIGCDGCPAQLSAACDDCIVTALTGGVAPAENANSAWHHNHLTLVARS